MDLQASPVCNRFEREEPEDKEGSVINFWTPQLSLDGKWETSPTFSSKTIVDGT